MKRYGFIYLKNQSLLGMLLILVSLASVIIEPFSGLIAKAASTQDASYKIAGYVKNCNVMQGGASDGQNLYYICTNSGNDIRIIKTSVSGDVIDTSPTFSRNKLGHANDMTYNSKLGLLVVSTWDTSGGGDGVAFIDPSTFELKYTKNTRDGHSTSNLCYNSSTDQYVIGGKIYDSEFNYTNKRLFTAAGVDDDTGATEGRVLNQGIECDNKYVYVMRVIWGQSGYNIISIYDWEGNNVSIYKINLNDEGENLAILGGSLYMGINEGSMSKGGSAVHDYFIRIEDLVIGNNECESVSPESSSDPSLSTNAGKALNNVWPTASSLVCCDTASSAGMSGDTNFARITTYLSSKGLSKIAIAGILGNWDVESPRQSAFRQQIRSPWPSGGYGLAQWTGSRRTSDNNLGVVDTLKKDSRSTEYFSQYYDNKYGEGPPENGVPNGVPAEVNDAWLQVELDFMLQEFTQKQYDIGGGYTKLLKTAVPYLTNGTDLKAALNSAKSASDAALIFTAIFEKQGALKSISELVGSESTESVKAKFLSAVKERTSQAEADVSKIEPILGVNAGTGGASCSDQSSTINGLPEGGVKDTKEGISQAWQIAQMFIDDLNKRYPKGNFADVDSTAGYDDTHVNTPGTGTADNYSCWAGASRCGQCYALTAWFTYKFTTAPMGTTTESGDGVVPYMKSKGVSTGNEAKVYSVFSYGRAEGGGGAHTGVVVGIDGDYAITIENNWGPGGRLVVRKHKKDGASFRDTGGGKTVFAYVSEKFRESPKELD